MKSVTQVFLMMSIAITRPNKLWCGDFVMKNYFLNMLLLVMTLSVVGCGGESGESSTANPAPTTNEPTSGSATLSWTAPATRTDGSSLPMNEIAGYKIYMGSSATNLALVADISDAYTVEYKLDDLGQGTHYFAVSTYSTSDIESDVSQIVSKTI